MFGDNKIEHQVASDGMMLKVVKGSPFLTIQGEGPFIGRAAVFIRLHGCNLACTFCDTYFDDPDDPVTYLPDLLVAVQGVKGKAKLVVITGGEPMRQNIIPLCEALVRLGMDVQIETAGTLWLEGIERHATIVCSPKTPVIHKKAWEHADVFKYVIDARMEFDGYIPVTATQANTKPRRLAAPRPGADVYLSPCDTYDANRNQMNRRLVGKLAIEHDVLAGVQLHKLIGVD